MIMENFGTASAPASFAYYDILKIIDAGAVKEFLAELKQKPSAERLKVIRVRTQ